MVAPPNNKRFGKRFSFAKYSLVAVCCLLVVITVIRLFYSDLPSARVDNLLINTVSGPDLRQILDPHASPKKTNDLWKRRGEQVFRNSTCPWVFGLGNQKSGTSAIVRALGEIANVRAKSDLSGFVEHRPRNDTEVASIVHSSVGYIMKEAEAMHHLYQIRRICPDTRYYLVTRDLMQNVRSLADRLNQIGFNVSGDCTDPANIETLREGWRPVLWESSSPSCIFRLAEYTLKVYRETLSFIQTLPFHVPIIEYEDFATSNQTAVILDLCHQLDYLRCNTTTIVSKIQRQPAGANRHTALSQLWPPDILQQVQRMQAEQIRMFAELYTK